MHAAESGRERIRTLENPNNRSPADGGHVNRSELLNELAARNDMTRREADVILTSLTDLITETVASGNDVAMYRAKSQGKAGWAMDPSSLTAAQNEPREP